MKRMMLIVLLLTPLLVFAQKPTPPPVPAPPNVADTLADLMQLVIEDQWDRGNDFFGHRPIPPDLHGQTLAQRDEARQAAVRKLLDEGKLISGNDFFYAALIFQHSEKPQDILFAHVLAVTATMRGNHNGRYLAAATLDRYLWETKQPQVFGTQFQDDAQGKPTMEPYDRKALSDEVRAFWCVLPVGEQEKILKDFQNGKPLQSTGARECD